jgi:hypothetical protein
MRPRPAGYPQNVGWPEPASPGSLAGKRQEPAGFVGESEAGTVYDPSFLGAYGRLRQQEMVADAQRRAARWKATPSRAGRREQRAERRLRYSLMFWRSVARIRRERSECARQPNFGVSVCVGCASGENDNPAASNQPPRAQGAEVVFEPGRASQRDVVEF